MTPRRAFLPLPREFFARSVLEVAPELVGAILVRELPGGGRLTGRIVEVEAYDGERDLACHASRGRTPRNETLYGEPGRAYVYLCYGMHFLLNAVSAKAGYPAAALIRAIEPLDGREAMRPGRSVSVTASRPERIASGPGRLSRAFHVDLSLNRTDLCAKGPLWIAPGEPVRPRDLVRGPRIGVESAGAPWNRKAWRFGLRDHPALSVRF